MSKPFRRRGVRVGAAVFITLLALGSLTPTAGAHRIGTAPAPPTAAVEVASEAENYVQWVYESLLFRPAEPVALEYWTGLVEAFGPAPFVNVVVTSDEWRKAWVDAFYDSVWLGRPADPGALTYWSGHLASGRGFDLFESVLASSPEAYAAGGGNDRDYVDHVVRSITLRAPTDAEVHLGVTALATGARSDFVYAVLHSNEGLASRVAVAYQRTLDRVPDPGGASYWAGYYHGSGSLAQMMGAQIQTAEAWNLAQTPGLEAQDVRALLDR